MKTKPNDPVYPNEIIPNPGISVREHFAAMALTLFHGHAYNGRSEHEIAKMAVGVADALIEALNKEENK